MAEGGEGWRRWRAEDGGGWRGGEKREKKASSVYYKGENINSPLAVGRDVSIGSHCRATLERLAAKRGSLMSRSQPHVYLCTRLNF